VLAWLQQADDFLALLFETAEHSCATAASGSSGAATGYCRWCRIALDGGGVQQCEWSSAPNQERLGSLGQQTWHMGAQH
jgi:hypothetical protein